MSVAFTVFVGCIGRPSIERTIRSFCEQTDLQPTDRLVLVMNDADVDKYRILDDADVPGELFDIPVSFYVEDQKTVMKDGDKIADD